MQVSSASTSSLSKIPLSLNLSASNEAKERKVEAVERRDRPEDEVEADISEESLQMPEVDPAVEGKLDKLKMVQYAFAKALSINQLLEDELIFEPVL